MTSLIHDLKADFAPGNVGKKSMRRIFSSVFISLVTLITAGGTTVVGV
jgi:hypothetical protein